MAFDIEMIKAVCEESPGRVEATRKVTGQPLTLTKKNLDIIFTQGSLTLKQFAV